MNVLTSLIAPVSSLLDKFIEDKDQKALLAHEISTLATKQAQDIALAQIETNQQEAKGNWFQSGWRPATGWVCVVSFAINNLVSPIASGFGVEIPQADMGVMMPVLMGMLGLGTMRSLERIKGVGK